MKLPKFLSVPSFVLVWAVGLFASASLTANSAFPSAEDEGSGQWVDPGFGTYWDLGSNWIWSEDQGYLYVYNGGDWDGAGVYFWDFGMGRWMWSSVHYYPYVYAWGSDMGWQKSLKGEGPGKRQFYNPEDEGTTVFEAGYVVTGTVYTVNSTSAFSTAVSSAQAGDLIEVTANFSGSSVSVKNKVIENGTLRIRASEIGGIGLKSISIENSEGIILEGFRFGPNTSSTYCKVVNSKRISILRNYFDCLDIENNQNGIVTTQASEDIEIGYNWFGNKNISATETKSKISGSYIKLQYDEPEMTKRMHVHHNYFKDIVPLAEGSSFAGDSDRECIVFGISDSQDVFTDHIVEYNLFEDCDGENEIITVKTSRNTIRYNTFLNCLGSVSVRFGTETEVYGNAFLADENNKNAYAGDTGGVRLYGSFHKVYNNYFNGLNGASWRIPILIDSGDTSNSSGGDGHEKTTYCEIVNNTIVDCAWGIGLGFNYSNAPKYNQIANNLIVNSQNTLYTLGKNAVNETTNQFISNIGWATGTGSIGVSGSTSEVWEVDPGLVASMTNGWTIQRLSAESPAIGVGAAGYDYLVDDMDGQARVSLDVGADEYSDARMVRYPVSANNVGPNPQ